MIRFWFGAGLFLAACGLVSSDIANIKLRFPKHDFRVDSADWGVPTGQTVPSVSCDLVSCSAVAAQFCGGGCTADCEEPAHTCQAHIPIVLRNDYDLAAESPEYQTIADQPVVSVALDGIWFNIDENTLNVATPTLGVYLGPHSITAATDVGAELVGTIPAVQPGQTGRIPVDFGAGGQAVLKKYMDDFHMPFRVLVSGSIAVHGGQPTPAGRLVGSVQADAHTSLGK